MLTFFFDQDGQLLIDFLQRGTTVNAQRYLQTFTILHQAIKSKRPGKLTRGVILLHGNTRPHTANTITALSHKFKWEVLGHPPYSPDLSPCDYDILGTLKGCEGAKDSPRTTRRQVVRAELVHSAAPGILRDSHSPPSVSRPPARFFSNVLTALYIC